MNKYLNAKPAIIPFPSIYRSINGNPSDNLKTVIELLGGIDNIVGTDYIVVIKPNVQWWNHGCPNLSALNTLVNLIMNRNNGFNGEVVVAENCHRGPEPQKSHLVLAYTCHWCWSLSSIHSLPDMIGEKIEAQHPTKDIKWIRLITDIPTVFQEIIKERMKTSDYLSSMKGKKEFAVLSFNDPILFFIEAMMVPYIWVKRRF